MLSRRLTPVLTGAIALLLVSCSVSRQISRERSALRVERDVVSTTDCTDVRDTLREVTTITIDRNDKGDTLKVVQIMDLTRARSRDNVVAQKVKTEVRVDTVYVERRDSVFVKNTNLSNPTNTKKSGFLTYVKWILAIAFLLLASVVLVRARH